MQRLPVVAHGLIRLAAHLHQVAEAAQLVELSLLVAGLPGKRQQPGVVDLRFLPLHQLGIAVAGFFQSRAIIVPILHALENRQRLLP